jgi:hypothetical protein
LQTGTAVQVERSDSSDGSSSGSGFLTRPANRAARWLARTLASPQAGRLNGKPRVHLVVICAVIFLSALGVRLLHQQADQAELFRKGTMMRGLIKPYWRRAERIIEEGTILFPREPADPGDARLLLHPPGYSILLAAVSRVFGNLKDLLKAVQIIQVFCDALSALLVFFIAAELLPLGVAIIAAMLVAISPHLAYYSLWLSPDSLAVLPILIAVYLVIRAIRRPRLSKIVASGMMLGLSCWLRSNGLLLAPFLAVLMPPLFEPGKRWRYALTMAAAMMITISPITIRNWVVYHHFVPLTLASGINLIQGIAEYDRDGRFGMPLGDGEAKQKDIEWNNRPDYAEGLWKPDGIERDRVRFAHGLAVVRSNPGWFLGAMLRRAAFTLSYNDSRSHSWPFYTAIVPPLSTEPAFGHWPATTEGLQPAWSNSPDEALAEGFVTSPETEVSLAADGRALKVAGDNSDYGDQFVFAPIVVEKNTDYVLRLALTVRQGHAAVKITRADRRITLATATPQMETEEERPAKKRSATRVAANEGFDSTSDRAYSLIEMPFASGGETEVRLVLSNNQTAGARVITEVGKAELFALGPTPCVWTRYPRALVRVFEKSLFTTARMLPLIVIGILLMALAKRGRALLILLAVPVYFVCSHAAFSTEYRYVLAIHYFLFVMAAVALYSGGAALSHGARLMTNRIFARSPLPS